VRVGERVSWLPEERDQVSISGCQAHGNLELDALVLSAANIHPERSAAQIAIVGILNYQ